MSDGHTQRYLYQSRCSPLARIDGSVSCEKSHLIHIGAQTESFAFQGGGLRLEIAHNALLGTNGDCKM
jgi:hypothetical protein